MTIAAPAPPLGLTRSATHFYTWRDGTNEYGPYPGVTSIIKMLDKSAALVGWAKRETAACAVRNLDMLTQLVATGGQPAAVNWLKSIPDYQRDTSADLGTRVHALAEQMSLGYEITASEDERPFVVQYYNFLQERAPLVLRTEFMVFSLHQQYGGTGDLLCDLDGETWLIDYKTGSGIYAETSLQLAGLAGAAFLGEPGNPQTIARPRIDRYGVLHLRPDSWRLVEYHVGPDEWRAFTACRALYGWNETRAKEVMR